MDFPARCTSPKCGRNIYSPVTFCPFCGTRFVLSDEERIRQSGKAFEPQVVEPPPAPVSTQQSAKENPVAESIPIRSQGLEPEKIAVPVSAKPPATAREPSVPSSGSVREEGTGQKETESSGRNLRKGPPPEADPIKPPTPKDEIGPKKKAPFALIAGAVGGIVLIGVAILIFRGPGASPPPPPSGPKVVPRDTPVSPRNGGTKKEMDKNPPIVIPDKSPVAATAEVKIATNPPGAVVSVDGEKWGISPAYVKNLSPGQHVFDISKSGFRDEHINVTLSKGDKKDLQVSLASLPQEPPPSRPPPAPSRDETTERDLAEAIRNYEQGKLDVSIVQFEAVLRRDATNQRAKEYLNNALEKRKKATEKWMQDIDTAPVTGGRKR